MNNVKRYCNIASLTPNPFSGFLVLTDQYFPGWKAFVDGKETSIYKVDGLLRGVVVPEGRHMVEFKYRPEKVFIASLFSIIALLVTLFIALKCSS